MPHPPSEEGLYYWREHEHADWECLMVRWQHVRSTACLPVVPPAGRPIDASVTPARRVLRTTLPGPTHMFIDVKDLDGTWGARIPDNDTLVAMQALADAALAEDAAIVALNSKEADIYAENGKRAVDEWETGEEFTTMNATAVDAVRTMHDTTIDFVRSQKAREESQENP